MSNSKNLQEVEKKSKEAVVGRVSASPKKGSRTGLVLLIIVVASFLGAPLFGVLLSGGLNQFQFGKYASRPVTYTQGSYFARLVERQRQEYASLLSGAYAYPMLQIIMENAFHQAMIHEAWIYESQRAGVLVSSDEVARVARTEGLTDAILANMSVVDRSEFFKAQQQDLVINRFQSGALDNVKRDSRFLEFILNPVPYQRSIDLSYIAFSQIDNDFLGDYIANHRTPLQKWQLRRYVHIGDAASVESIAQDLKSGNTTLAALALAQSESQDLSYRDAYADQAGMMPSQLLYQIQQQSRLSVEELYATLSGLSQGQVTDPIVFNGAPAGSEAYVFYQLESLPQDPDLSDGMERDAIVAYLASYDILALEQYFRNLQSSTQEVMGVKRISSEYFSMIYGLEMRGGYSPYNGLVKQFESAFGDLDSATVQSLANSKEFFTQAFTLSLEEASGIILLPNGAIWFTPLSQETYQSQYQELDIFYMSQFLRMQAQSSMEEYFKNSSRYRDGQFDKAFAHFAKQIGLTPQ